MMSVSALLICQSAFSCGSNADGSLAETAAVDHAQESSPLASEVKCAGTELTVKNVLVWCEVTVGSNPPSSAREQNVCVPDGTVDLAATPLTGYMLGKHAWHDTTTTEKGGLATVTVTGGKACVWVCCPGLGGSAPCPDKKDECL